MKSKVFPMKKMIVLSLLFLLLGLTGVGCEKRTIWIENDINDLLDKLEAAINADDLTQGMSCFSFPYTYIDSTGTKTYNYDTFGGVLTEYMNSHHLYNISDRKLALTDLKNATVTCVTHFIYYSIFNPIKEETEFTLVSTGDGWKITVTRILSST